MPTPRAITGTLRRQGDDAPLVGASVTFEAYQLIVDEHATHPPTSVTVTSAALGALSFSLTPGWWRVTLPGARPATFRVPEGEGALTLEALLLGSGAYVPPSQADTFQDMIDAALATVEGATLSDATPQPLGTAAAGDDAEGARGDHIHAMPTAAQVGAATADDIATHAADTTSVHGIADTSALLTAAALAAYYTSAQTDTLLDGKADSATTLAGYGIADALTAAAIAATYATIASLTAHTGNTSNPHSVTKAQVGLGSVENYAIASQAEAEAGTANDRYMTALRTAEAIAALAAGGGLDEATADTLYGRLAAVNLWAARQDLRASGATHAAALYARGMPGDTLPLVKLGSSSGTDNPGVVALQLHGFNEPTLQIYNFAQIGISLQADNDTGIGVYAVNQDSDNKAAISGKANSGVGLRAETVLAPTRALIDTIAADTSSTTGTATHLRFRQASTGTPGAGFGVRHKTLLQSSTTAARDAAYDDTVWTDATDASRSAERRVLLAKAGTLTEAQRVDFGAGAGTTGLLLWDVDNNTLERVTVGAADSGGSGFKLLRIAN